MAGWAPVDPTPLNSALHTCGGWPMLSNASLRARTHAHTHMHTRRWKFHETACAMTSIPLFCSRIFHLNNAAWPTNLISWPTIAPQGPHCCLRMSGCAMPLSCPPAVSSAPNSFCHEPVKWKQLSFLVLLPHSCFRKPSWHPGRKAAVFLQGPLYSRDSYCQQLGLQSMPSSSPGCGPTESRALSHWSCSPVRLELVCGPE